MVFYDFIFVFQAINLEKSVILQNQLIDNDSTQKRGCYSGKTDWTKINDSGKKKITWNERFLLKDLSLIWNWIETHLRPILDPFETH